MGSAKLMTTGTSVPLDVPWLLAGMQRGSSDRSHQSGGASGVCRTCTSAEHPSADNRSHMQSAALADAASRKSMAPTTSTWRRVLMAASSKLTDHGASCNISSGHPEVGG